MTPIMNPQIQILTDEIKAYTADATALHTEINRLDNQLQDAKALLYANETISWRKIKLLESILLKQEKEMI